MAARAQTLHPTLTGVSATVPAPRAGHAAASTAPADEFVPGNYPIFRVNPTESASLVTERHQADLAVIRTLARLELEQRSEAAQLTDLLHDLAPTVADEVRTGTVLPLRRAIHNLRTPRPGYDLQALGQEAAAARIRRWLERQEHMEGLRALLLERHEEMIGREREQLREILASEPLRRSLAMSSTLLPSAAERYRRSPFADLDKRGRKSEQSLLRYAMRAGTKTSPFSQYTVVGYPGRRGRTAVDPRRLLSHVTLNTSYLRRLESALRRLPEAAAHIRVHASAGLQLRDGRLVATGQRDALGTSAAEIATRYGEAQVSIPATPTALALLRWLGQQPYGTASAQDISALLCTQVSGVDQARAAGYVQHLLDCGVLACTPIVDEHCPDALGELRTRMAQAPGGGTPGVLSRVDELLGELSQTAGQIGTASDSERVGLLQRSERTSRQLLSAVGDDDDERELPTPLWYEDTWLADGTDDVHGELAPITADIGRFLQAVQIFDEQHVFSRVLVHRFVERFGPGGSTDNLDELARLYLPSYDDALQITEGFDHPLLAADPLLGDLARLREDLLGPLRRTLAGAGSGPDVHISGDWVDEVEHRFPQWFRARPASYGVFLQPRGPVLSDGVVLNKIYNGWGNYVSRFLVNAPPHVLDRVRDSIRSHHPVGEVVAEFRPVNGFNANIHPALTEAEIDVDGRATPGQLPLERLDVRHNRATDRVELLDRATGQRVNPLYLGFLIPYYLPSRLVPLTAMAGSGSIMFEPQVSADRSGEVDRSRIRAYPRVVFGDLVVARRRWHVPSQLIPRQQPSEGDEDYFVRFNQWRAGHGIAEEVFLHPPAPELEPGQVNDYFGSYLGNRKPQYLASASRLHCKHLKRLLVEQPGVDVVFEEALPRPEDGLQLASGRHTTEIVIDFYRHGSRHPHLEVSR